MPPAMSKIKIALLLLVSAVAVWLVEAALRQSPSREPELATTSEHGAVPQAGTAGSNPSSGNAFANLEAIPTWHLFGKPADVPGSAPARATAPAVDPDTLPDTSLTLTLVGVFFAEDKPYAWVIIEAPGVGHRRYTVGDTLPGGAVIDAIQRKAVVLDQNGKKEALRLRNRPSSGAARDARYANLPVEQAVPENDRTLPPAAQK